MKLPGFGHIPSGYFCHETLTMRFGGPLSKPEKQFTTSAIKVPDYKYQVWEREDAGGGWYGSGKELITRTEKNSYIILRGGKVIGWTIPYHGGTIKSALMPLDWRGTPAAIKSFAEKLIATTNK